MNDDDHAAAAGPQPPTNRHHGPIDASITDLRRALLGWLQSSRSRTERRTARALGDRHRPRPPRRGTPTRVLRHAPADVRTGDRLGAWQVVGIGDSTWTLHSATHTLEVTTTVTGPARCNLSLVATPSPAAGTLAALHAELAARARTAARAGLRPGASTVPQRGAARPGPGPQA